MISITGALEHVKKYIYINKNSQAVLAQVGGSLIPVVGQYDQF